MKYTLLAAALLAATAAHAGPDYINVGGGSYHYDANGRAWGFNESNPGLGVTWAGVQLPAAGTADVSVGYYKNSLGRGSFYAGFDKLPYSIAGGRAGITAIVATGYDVPVLPIVAPTICWQYVCTLVTPPIKGKTVGMASLQFRFPLTTKNHD